MGCGVSRIDSNTMAFPARLRPVFLPRLDEIFIRKHKRHVYDSTLSKKKFLSHESDSSKGSKMTTSSGEDSTRFGCNDKDIKGNQAKKPKEEVSHDENSIGTRIGDMNEANIANEIIFREDGESVKPEQEEDNMEDVFMDVENDDDEDDDYDDNDLDGGRTICHMNGETYIGSPSFRIYYKDNGEDEDEKSGENHVVENVGVDVAVDSKESYLDEKVEKRSRKQTIFKKVLAKGLSVKSCYAPTHASHDHAHLLTGKEHA